MILNMMAIKMSYYLNKHINTVFKFQNIDEETVKKTIQSLPTKIVVDLMVFLQNE